MFLSVFIWLLSDQKAVNIVFSRSFVHYRSGHQSVQLAEVHNTSRAGGSKKPKGFAFKKHFFHSWSVTAREMHVLKCLSRFKVRADVKDWIFKDSSDWEIYFLLWYYSRKFYGQMVPVCFWNKLIYFLSFCVPQGEHVIDVPYPLEGFILL